MEDEYQDAAASEDTALESGQEGNQGEEAEGLVTPSEEEDFESGQSEGEAEESTEGHEAETATEEKKGDKKSLEERAAEIAKKLVAEEMAAFEAKFAKQQQEKPDYKDIDITAYAKYVTEVEDTIDELRLTGTPEARLRARELSRHLDKLEQEREENETKRKAFLERQNKSKSAGDANQARLQKLDEAADFYRDHLKIEKPVWDKMGAWFTEQCQKDPVLGREFAEQVDKGAVGAIRWAHEYTAKNMGAKERALNETKNTNKEKSAAASPNPGGKSVPVDLSKALAKAKELNTDQAWAEYQQLKRAVKR